MTSKNTFVKRKDFKEFPKRKLERFREGIPKYVSF